MTNVESSYVCLSAFHSVSYASFNSMSCFVRTVFLRRPQSSYIVAQLAEVMCEDKLADHSYSSTYANKGVFLSGQLYPDCCVKGYMTLSYWNFDKSFCQVLSIYCTSAGMKLRRKFRRLLMTEYVQQARVYAVMAEILRAQTFQIVNLSVDSTAYVDDGPFYI